MKWKVNEFKLKMKNEKSIDISLLQISIISAKVSFYQKSKAALLILAHIIKQLTFTFCFIFSIEQIFLFLHN